MEFIKRAINSVFNVFGYQVTRKSNPKARAARKWIDIHDPISHNSVENLNKFYSDDSYLKEYINEDRIAFYSAVTQFLTSTGTDFSNKNIVDVGCGSGQLLQHLAQEYDFKDCTGLEYSPEAVKLAASLYPDFKFFEYDIYSTWKHKYDLVVCTEVLEHLLNPAKALHNLLDMTKVNGKIFITVPNGRLDNFGGHINFWSPESWEVFIKDSGKGNKHQTGTLMDQKVNYALIEKNS